MKSESVTVQMKATEQYFHVVLFIMLYKVVLSFESVDEILKCDHLYSLLQTRDTELTLTLLLFFAALVLFSFLYLLFNARLLSISSVVLGRCSRPLSSPIRMKQQRCCTVMDQPR